MKIEKKKTHKKLLYLTEDQFNEWSRTVTPRILRFAIEIQDMIKFISDNDIMFDEIRGLRML